MDGDVFHKIRKELDRWSKALMDKDCKYEDYLVVVQHFGISGVMAEDVVAVLGAMLSRHALKEKSDVSRCMRRANKIKAVFNKPAKGQKTVIDRWLEQKNNTKPNKKEK